MVPLTIDGLTYVSLLLRLAGQVLGLPALPVRVRHHGRRRMAHSGTQVRVMAAMRRMVPGSQRS